MISRIIRILALTNLFNALLDAARLLGIGASSDSPMDMMGQSDFAFLMAFTLSRLFAAVGMWIFATWGTILLMLTSLIELILLGAGVVDLEIGFLGWVLRVIVLLGTTFVLAMAFRTWRLSVHD